MRKRNYLIIIGIVLIFGLFILHFFFGIFSRYSYITAKIDLLRNKPSIIQYGATPVVEEAASRFLMWIDSTKKKVIDEKPSPAGKEAIQIAKRFGFEYIIVNESMFSYPNRNGIKYYNSVMTNYIRSKHGENWEDQFNFDVDSLFKINRIDTIKQILFALPENLNTKNSLDSQSIKPNPLVIIIKDMKHNNLDIIVGIQFNNGICVYLSYYFVNPYTLQIEEYVE